MIRRPPRSPRTDILCPATALCRSTQRTSTLNRAEIGSARRKLDPQPYENPYNPLSPLSPYALAATRHMHQYRSEEHTSELQSLMRNPYAVFCFKKTILILNNKQ